MAAATDRRRRDLARIHCLAKELGLDDDEYRDVLWAVCRVRSSAALDAHGRETVIRHLESRRQKQPAPTRQPRVGSERKPLVRKIEAQLRDLNAGDAYADAITRQMFNIERWRWCDPGQLHKIVAALTYAQRRQGAKG